GEDLAKGSAQDGRLACASSHEWIIDGSPTAASVAQQGRERKALLEFETNRDEEQPGRDRGSYQIGGRIKVTDGGDSPNYEIAGGGSYPRATCVPILVLVRVSSIPSRSNGRAGSIRCFVT